MFKNVFLSIHILFFFTYFIIVSNTVSRLKTCHNFVIDVQMNGRRVRDNLRNVTRVLKFEDCIKLCAMDILCKSIFYNSGNSKCENVGHYVSQNTSQIDFGWIYLEKFRCCKSGWLRFQKHCYLFKKGKFTLSEAQVVCEKEGAYMVELRSFTVQEFVKQNMEKDGLVVVWTGGRKQHGQWKWAHSGQPFGYTNWYPRDPNGDGIAMDYNLYYRPGYWTDVPSKFRRNVICQSDVNQ